MDKNIKKMYKSSFLSRIENSISIGALRKGLMLIIPILLIGSFCTILMSFPVESYQVWIQEIGGGFLYKLISWMHNATIGVVSLYCILSISYSYARQVNRESLGFYMLTSVASFIIYTSDKTEGISAEIFDATWMFTAMMITLLSCIALTNFSRRYDTWNIKKWGKKLEAEYQNVLALLVPVALTLGVVLLLKAVTVVFFSSNIRNTGTAFMEEIFHRAGTGALGAVLFVFLIHFLWFFGIHGSNLLVTVSTVMFEEGLYENIAAVAGGGEAAHIFTKTFIDVFVLMGGSGTTICLLAAMAFVMIREKDKRYKQMFKISVIPGIFNINEIILFGFPVVFNPVMLIPFMLVPMLITFNSALAMYLGWVPIPFRQVHWTTPILFSGYLCTESIRGILLQAFNVLIGTLIYIPFIRMSRQYYDGILEKNITNLREEMISCEEIGAFIDLKEGPQSKLDMVKLLTQDLREAVAKDEIKLHYQPQVRSDGSIYGVEALLRWKHPVAGYLYPPMVIEIARQDHMLDELGISLINKAARDLEYIACRVSHPIHMAVNISPVQFENENFCELVRDVILKYDFKECTLCFEVTEQMALSSSRLVAERIEELKKEGIPFHMDDFGMGHSSMKYLQSSEFEAIKLDGSLVRQVLENERSQSIIKGIQKMASPLNYELIAEYVETEEQRDILQKIGCSIYQGTLYSWPLPLEELEKFLEKHGAYRKK